METCDDEYGNRVIIRNRGRRMRESKELWYGKDKDDELLIRKKDWFF